MLVYACGNHLSPYSSVDRALPSEGRSRWFNSNYGRVNSITVIYVHNEQTERDYFEAPKLSCFIHSDGRGNVLLMDENDNKIRRIIYTHVIKIDIKYTSP